MSFFLFEQAMRLSGDDPMSLTELVKYLFSFEIQQGGLLTKLKELGKTWSDEEKYHPWLALTELKYRLIENKCEERKRTALLRCRSVNGHDSGASSVLSGRQKR